MKYLSSSLFLCSAFVGVSLAVMAPPQVSATDAVDSQMVVESTAMDPLMCQDHKAIQKDPNCIICHLLGGG